MVPAGYLAKRVWVPTPEFGCPRITAVYSVADCLSEPFGDYVPLFRHNGFRLFDTEAAVRAAAGELGASLDGTRMFYFEVHSEEWDEDRAWAPFAPLPDSVMQVVPPAARQLEGFDVVSTFSGPWFCCSPLTCNGLATEIETNARGLLATLEQARRLLESGVFRNSEPGPYRIVAVYTLPFESSEASQSNSPAWRGAE